MVGKEIVPWSCSRYSVPECLTAIKLLKQRLEQLTGEDYKSKLATPVEELQLSVRAQNVLYSQKLHTVEQVLDYGIDRLALVQNCGKKSLGEISKAVDSVLASVNYAADVLLLVVNLESEGDLTGRIENQGRILAVAFAATMEELIQKLKEQLKTIQQHHSGARKFDTEAVIFKLKLEL